MRKATVTLPRFSRYVSLGQNIVKEHGAKRRLHGSRLSFNVSDRDGRTDGESVVSALPVLPSEQKVARSFEGVTENSSSEVWKRLSRRLLDTRGGFTEQEFYFLEESIRWWARRRVKYDVVDPQSAKMVWPLWIKLSGDKSIDRGTNELLNVVLDHWRLCVKQGIHLPVSTKDVISHVQSLPEALVDTRSYVLMLSTMAYSKDVNPHQAELLLNALPGHIPVNTILMNAALTVWAKADVSRWPDAYKQADGIFRNLTKVSVRPDEVSYACLLEAHANSASDVDSLSRAQEIFEEVQNEGMTSSIANMQMMRAWANSGSNDGPDAAYKLLSELVGAFLQDRTFPQKPTKQSFSVVMEGYARVGKPDRVEQILLQLQDLFQKTNDEDFLPTAATFNSVLTAYARCPLVDRAERAEELLMSLHEMATWSDRPECRPDTTSVNTVINAWAESRQYSAAVDRAENLLKLTEAWPGVLPDAYSYTSVMKTWARSDRPNAPNRCESYLRQMWDAHEAGNSHLRPTVTTYSTIIYAWSRSKNMEAPVYAESVFHEMLERFKSGEDCLKPTESTYMTLMTTWNRSELPEARSRVFYYFNQIRDRYLSGDISLRPSARVYNAVLAQLKKCGDGEKAEEVLQIMQKDFEDGNSSARPNTKVFNTVLSAWANSKFHGRTERAESLLREMHRLHVEENWESMPDVISYSCILDCWAKSNRPEAPARAEAILHHMRTITESGDQRLKPTSHAWATVINAWARSEDAAAPEHAEALLDEMQNQYLMGDRTMRPSGPAYSGLISCWAKTSRDDGPKRALEVLETMRERHEEDPSSEKPNRLHYASVINAFANKGDVINAEKLLHTMIKSGSPSPHYGCFNGTLKAIARSTVSDGPRRAEDIFARMKNLSKRGLECSPTVVTYTTLLDIWRQNPGEEAVRRAEALMKEMLQMASQKGGKTPVPNAGTFLVYLRILLNSDLTDSDKESKVSEAFDLMRVFGCKPTRAILQEVKSRGKYDSLNI